jgi:ubiquinone biosynthesis accessory factor UbiK
MFDSKSIDDIANRLANAIPPSFNHFKEDAEKNFHAILQSALARLDLVSREEFEVQKAVLAKTRQKLEALEQRVAEMEQQAHKQEDDIKQPKSAKSKQK